MKIEDLAGIDWSSITSTPAWAMILNEILDLAKAADSNTERTSVADAFDEFANHSFSGDLHVIARLDSIARNAAQAMRRANMEAAVSELKTASADFRALTKEINASTAALKKEASALRLTKQIEATSSITATIAAVNALEQAEDPNKDQALATAIAKLVDSAQHLRRLLEARP